MTSWHIDILIMISLNIFINNSDPDAVAVINVMQKIMDLNIFEFITESITVV